MGRDKYPSQSLGSLFSRIKTGRVLLIGAGGIGCELLKNLSLTGFGEIHVIDLDTIDLSNLNRQFLFRHEHIAKPKAYVARESAAGFNPKITIKAYHANIKDAQFSVSWFRSFILVFNALDNLDARRHVNKMCLAADVPLIESGTTGFNGQVQPIKRSVSECYECNVKETPKTYPVCTIRSTPSQPIHCIVWAKSYLFAEIFGYSDENASDFDSAAEDEDSDETRSLQKEAHALKLIRESMISKEFPERVFRKVFEVDILRLRSMEDMWKSRKAPETLDFKTLLQPQSQKETDASLQDRRLWTLTENAAIFVDSLFRLRNRMVELASKDPAKAHLQRIDFDKDDTDILDFVTASANLRCTAFGIEPKSKFEIKQMAGNIIPAIATTNAMVAGLCVLQAFKFMREDYNKCKTIYLTKAIDRVISAELMSKPNRDCPVCSVVHSDLIIDPSRATLKDLVENRLRHDLGYEEFSVSTEAGLIYDTELDDNLGKKFSDLGITSKNFITVVDEEDDNPRVNVVLSINEENLPPDADSVSLPTTLEISRKPSARVSPKPNAEEKSSETNGTIGKRKRASPEISTAMKPLPRQKKAAKITDLTDSVTTDDSANGAILLDD